MQTCKECGKVSEFEYCFNCYRKVNGLLPGQKIPCNLCGAPATGYRCKACRSKNAHKHKKEHCVDCGKELGLSYAKHERRCVKCAGKYYGAQKKAKNNAHHPDTLICSACGKEFPFRLVKSTNKPVKVCSFSCATKLKHARNGHTAEAMEKRIREFITSVDYYVSESEIKAKLSITRQQLRRFNIDTTKINVELGRTEVVKGTLKAKRKDYTGKSQWSIPAIRVERDSPKAVELREKIISWLQHRQSKATVRDVLKEFHIDFYSTWKRFGFDVAELHNAAGVPYSRTTSWHEIKVATDAKELFGEDDIVTQKRFDDLKSTKGWPLRFDIYVKSRNCLIEVDGEQHYNKDHTYCKKLDTDTIKSDYAKAHGIALERLRIAPTATFDQRAAELLVKIKNMDVVKESELLEAPPSNVEGNQQPIKESPKSKDMASGKGSTTIP